jgi:hypothetical protein
MKKEDKDNLPELIRCTICKSPRLEYRSFVRLERNVLGIARISSGDEVIDVVAIQDEGVDDALLEEHEVLFCLNCHHEMTIAEMLKERTSAVELVYDFFSEGGFDELRGIKIKVEVEERENDGVDEEDHQGGE